jgi:hypothetical protein
MQRAARLFARHQAGAWYSRYQGKVITSSLNAVIERHPVLFDTRGNALVDYAVDYIVLRNAGQILAVYRVSEDSRHIWRVEPEKYPDALIGSPE